MFGDKYHAGVPADRMPPSRQAVPVGPGDRPEYVKPWRPFAALRMFIYRILHLWHVREAIARRQILRSIEIRHARRVSTVGLILDGLRGGPAAPARYDHMETAHLMALARATGATMMGSWDLGSGGSSSTGGVVIGAPTPTGNTATDKANLASAASQAATEGMGTVVLQAGTYRGASSSRSDASVTYTGSGSNYTWTDTSIVAADVGSYVIGTGINGKAPHILSVTAGSGFVTDIPPGGSVSAQAMEIVSPVMVLPDGVSLQGQGGGWGLITGAYTLGTAIYDSGTGITVLHRGSASAGNATSRSKIHDMAIWGSPTAQTIGNTLAGFWINNNSFMIEINQCDISGHGSYGMVLEFAVNALDCRNTTFNYNGNASNSYAAGGVIEDPYDSSDGAGVNFYNCFFISNNGFGLATGVGKTPFSLYGCQFNFTGTSNCYLSGTSLACSGQGFVGCIMSNCWSESSSTYDVTCNYANVTIIGSVLASTTTNGLFLNNGNMVLVGTSINNHTNSVNYSTGTLTWNACTVSDTNFITGGTNVPTPAQASGVGTYGGGVGLYSPSAITPATSVTVTSNAATVPVTCSVAKLTNSSAAAMTITLATSGAIDGQQLQVRVYNFSAVNQNISWVNTESGVTPAATTNGTSTTIPRIVTFIYNATNTKWTCVQSV